MDGETSFTKVLKWDSPFKNLSIHHMVRVEQRAEKFLVVFNNARRNVGHRTDVLIKMRWVKRQSTSTTQEGYERFRQPRSSRYVVTVYFFVVLATREIRKGTSTVEPKIDVNTVLLPKKVYLTVVGQA